MVSSLTHECWVQVPSPTIMASAGVEALLLSIIKNNFNFQRSNTTEALLMSTYSALFFFLSATLSGLILTKRFEEFPVWTSWGSDPIGSKRSWIWVMRHHIISVIAGTISVIAQVLLYGWLEESIFVKGALSVMTAFGVLFLVHIIRLLSRN